MVVIIKGVVIDQNRTAKQKKCFHNICDHKTLMKGEKVLVIIDQQCILFNIKGKEEITPEEKKGGN